MFFFLVLACVCPCAKDLFLSLPLNRNLSSVFCSFLLIFVISRNGLISLLFNTNRKQNNEKNIKVFWQLLFKYSSGSYRNTFIDFSGVLLFFLSRIIQISCFITYADRWLFYNWTILHILILFTIDNVFNS